MAIKRASTGKGRRRLPRKPAGVTSSSAADDVWEKVWPELRRQGLVRTAHPIRPPPDDEPRFEPIPISGEPLSETLIRERR